MAIADDISSGLSRLAHLAQSRADDELLAIHADLDKVRFALFGGKEASTFQPEPTAETAPAETEPETTSDVAATPAAQAHAEETGVDLTTVEGTGKDGTITKSDVAEAASSTPES